MGHHVVTSRRFTEHVLHRLHKLNSYIWSSLVWRTYDFLSCLWIRNKIYQKGDFFCYILPETYTKSRKQIHFTPPVLVNYVSPWFLSSYITLTFISPHRTTLKRVHRQFLWSVSLLSNKTKNFDIQSLRNFIFNHLNCICSCIMCFTG